MSGFNKRTASPSLLASCPPRSGKSLTAMPVSRLSMLHGNHGAYGSNGSKAQLGWFGCKSRASKRKRFLQNTWSKVNARAGGVAALSHPVMCALDNYVLKAPYFVHSKDWFRFRQWMNARLIVLDRLCADGNSSRLGRDKGTVRWPALHVRSLLGKAMEK